MKISDSLYVLPIETDTGGSQNRQAPPVINPSLILDAEQGPSLVDTGMPGHHERLETLLGEIGLQLGDIRRIILTHQDLDHIGSAAEIVRRSGALVLAHAADTPYIEGTLKSIRIPPPAMLEKMPAPMRAVLERGAEPVKVDRQLQDGEVLDLAGGVEVVFTPGHTPGHISLYLKRDRVLIAGDAVRAYQGRLLPLVEALTPDMPGAIRSVAKLAELDIQTLIAYHGGLVREDLPGQLAAVAQGNQT